MILVSAARMYLLLPHRLYHTHYAHKRTQNELDGKLAFTVIATSLELLKMQISEALS